MFSGGKIKQNGQYSFWKGCVNLGCLNLVPPTWASRSAESQGAFQKVWIVTTFVSCKEKTRQAFWIWTLLSCRILCIQLKWGFWGPHHCCTYCVFSCGVYSVAWNKKLHKRLVAPKRLQHGFFCTDVYSAKVNKDLHVHLVLISGKLNCSLTYCSFSTLSRCTHIQHILISWSVIRSFFFDKLKQEGFFQPKKGHGSTTPPFGGKE